MSKFSKGLGLSLVVVAMMATSVFAGPKDGWQAVGGLSYDTFSTDASGVTAKGDLGYFLGGKYSMVLDKNSSLTSGVILSMNNAKHEVVVSGSTIAASTSVTYFNVPVEYNYFVGKDWKFTGGAYVGLSSTTGFDTNYGLTVGASYIMDRMTIDGAYNLGLADVAKDTTTTRIGSFTLGASYNF